MERESFGKTGGLAVGAARLCVSFYGVLIARSRATFQKFLVLCISDPRHGEGRRQTAFCQRELGTQTPAIWVVNALSSSLSLSFLLCMCAYTPVSVYPCLCVCVCTCVCPCVYVCMYVCPCLSVCVFTDRLFGQMSEGLEARTRKRLSTQLHP